jgi:hypothetical protein
MDHHLGFAPSAWALLLIAQLASARPRPAAPPSDHRDGLPFARWFARLASAAPILFLLFSFLPERQVRNLGPIMPDTLLMAGALAGVCAIVLFLAAARGIERWMGPVACMVAICLIVLSVLAGSATA